MHIGLKQSNSSITQAALLAALLFFVSGCGEHADLSLEEAQERLRTQQFSEALRGFQALSASDADDETVAAALFGEGQVYQHRRPNESFPDARSLYRRVIDEFPHTATAPAAHLALARSYELARSYDLEPSAQELEQLNTARDLYRDIIGRWPGTEEADQAALRFAITLVFDMTMDEASEGAALLERWTSENPDSPYLAAVCQFLGRVYLYPLEDYDKALDAMLRADAAGVLSYSLTIDLYYRIADVAHHSANRPDVARAYYEKLIDRFENDPRAYIARQRLEDMAQAGTETPHE